MNNLTFFAIVLMTGCITGLIYAGLNFLIVEPYIDKAIKLEIERLVIDGESIDSNQIDSYRIWQKQGSIVAAIILSIGLSSIFALIYPFARKGINGKESKRGLILASILWIVLFLVPFLKYPANPPAVGNPETIYYRQALYLAILGISASISLTLAYTSKNIKRYRFVLPIIYIAVITATFMILPNNPDEITISMDIVNNFRIASVISSLITWLSLGIIFGTLYQRFTKRAEKVV